MWVIFAHLNRIQQRKLMWIHADPDPQPCFHALIAFLTKFFRFFYYWPADRV